MTDGLTALDELKLYQEAHRTGPHRVRITAQAMTNVLTAAFGALADKDAEIGQLRARLSAAEGRAADAVRYLTAADAEIAKLRALHGEAANLLGEAGTEIARLQAEIDAASDHPPEYVIEAGLAAAMAADPHREDGARLRTTDGERKAWAWRKAKGEWEPLP